MAEPSKEDVEGKPWKYVGYRGYAEFIASDDDFLIFRRFDKVNSRLCLKLQDDVHALNEQLEELDRRYSSRQSGDVNNGTFRDDMEDRAKLLDQLLEKIERYNSFLLQQSELKKCPRAPEWDVESIRTWHENHDREAIVRDEQQYLDHDRDLVCIVQKDKTPLRRVIDSSLFLRTLKVWKKEKKGVSTYDKENVTYYSSKRINGFASGVIVAIGSAMLIAPIWILQALNTMKTKLAVITVFVLVFLLVLSFAMVAKPFEALGATAAYAAVLMVFLQLGTTDGALG